MTTDNNSGLAVTPTLPTTEVLDRIDRIAKIAAQSGLTTYRKTESASMVLLTGRELGLGPMASLRGIHDVSGRPVLAADLMVAVVRRSGLCQKWRVVKSTVDYCEIVTRRVGEEDDESCVWTAEDAKRAGCGGATWQKFPRQMLSHRCAAELARRVYSDVLLGLYCPDELGGDGGADVGDERPQPRETVIDAVVVLPRDNGPPPSRAVPARAPEDVVPPAPAPLPLTAAEHKAMMEMIGSAETPAALKASLREIADDVARGTEEQRGALRAAANARFAALTPPAPAPPDDEPPTQPPGGPRKPRKAPAADATGGGANDRQPPAEGPAAWLDSEDATRAHLATKGDPKALRNSAIAHGPYVAAKPWGVRVYAERIQALSGAPYERCEAIARTWCNERAAMPAARAA